MVKARNCYYMDGTIGLLVIEALLVLLALSISKATRFISPSLYGNGDQPFAVDDSSKDDVILTQTASPPPSHAVVSPSVTKYDVFLSFRGEDTGNTFASYLYERLRTAGIHTFMDYKLHKGEQISPILLRAIEESEISMIIFSQNYASSSWCMEELVHILECRKKFGRIAIPIFYDVDPSNIHKQKGGFGKGFDVLRQRFKDDQQKLKKWTNALIQSASLAGWDSNGIRPEFKLAEEIVKDTLSKLKCNSSSHLEGLVGIARHIENIEKLLSKARIVGIWGMGGAGKTTLAKAVFQELRAQFDASSFVENVKEQLARISLDELQKNCLKELLKDGDINIYNIKSNFVKSRLQRKKILLILDDVGNSIIAEDLTKVCDWFGEGSRIIVTSRNEQVLKNAYAFSRYHVPDLYFHDAFHLFSLKAFKKYEPSKGYMELSKSAVKYCQGNPLALVVLGCFLYGRGKLEWESTLEKLNQAPPKDIVDVLKLSFDGLDEEQKNVFLDLTFFTMEGGKFSLNIIRQLYGVSVDIEISVFREKSLVSFNHNGYIVMHDLVRKMGLEIARQQLLSDPKTSVRLWRHEDIYDFFIFDKDIKAIRCMSLDASKIKRITLRTSNFQKMHKLIFLKVYQSDRRRKLNMCEDLDYLPEELRFFSWEDYPLPYVPLHFCAENLIRLEMPNSNIRQLWNGYQYFPNLKEMILSHSKHLIALPDLSHSPKIERVYLTGCVNLAQIHSSTVPGKNNVKLCVGDSGPMQINIGGNIKGTSSGLVIVYNYLDLRKLSFNKVVMKLLVSRKIMSGVRFQHVVTPLSEVTELRSGIQRLASLLPFVRKLHWLESPIEFGDDLYYDHHCHFLGPDYFMLKMKVRGDRSREWGLVGPMRRKIINDDHQVAMTLMEVAEEEEQEYNKSDTLTRVPKTITRWSLLTQLILRSDIIGNTSCNIDQVSILKSLALSHSCKAIQPHLDAKLLFGIPPSALRDRHFFITYTLDSKPQRPHVYRCTFWLGCVVNTCRSFDSNYDLVLELRDWSGSLNII